jgi:type IV pilus assembly protein PilE
MVAAKVHRARGRRSIGGFTLIELMIVVVVIAILAVVAYPTYTEAVRKSRRADGITLLNSIAQAQERWRANCTTYATLPATANPAPPTCDAATRGLNIPNPSSGYYTAALSGVTAAGYSATATAAGGQAGDTNCAVLRLTMAGGNVRNFAGPSVATLADVVGNAASNVNARKCWGR